MAQISASVLYHALLKNIYILTELNASDVKFISVDRQKLDLSKDEYLWYSKFYICRDTTPFYLHKNALRIELNEFHWSKERGSTYLNLWIIVTKTVRTCLNSFSEHTDINNFQLLPVKKYNMS